MGILGSLLIAGRLLGQETEVSFCPNWDTRWTATDTFQLLALLAVTVAIMVVWRIVEARLRACYSPAAHRQQCWRRWRKWLPTGMVLAGGLLILAGERGLLDSAIGSAGAIAWGVLNLPAIIVISLAANLLGVTLAAVGAGAGDGLAAMVRPPPSAGGSTVSVALLKSHW